MTDQSSKRPHPLSALGPTQVWQAALLLPERYQDLSAPAQGIDDFDGPDDKRPITVRIMTAPSDHWPGAGARVRRPRTTFRVCMPDGEEITATVFGDTRSVRDEWTPGVELTFLASCNWWSDRASLVLHEPIDPCWIGRTRPFYAGKPRVLQPEEVRTLVHADLPAAVHPAAAFLRGQVATFGPEPDLLRDLGADGWTVEQLLEQSHTPASMAHAELAARVLRRIAALGALNRMPGRREGSAPPLFLTTLPARIASLSITLTCDQARTVSEIAAELAKPRPLRHLISGDVGVGKTIVALLLAMATVDAGGRAIVMAPNSRLAAQIHTEARTAFPDVDAALVTSDTDDLPSRATRLWIGTSALLHRGLAAPELLVIDEQHRFSVHQREQLMSQHTHLVEMTATPIPRSQALLQFGGVGMSQMRQTHSFKTFYTQLHEGADAVRRFFALLAPSIRSGDPLLVVYPLREATDEGAAETIPGSERYGVDRAFERWNQMYPGKVASLTARDDDQTKLRVLDDFGRGLVPILVSTSVVELGLNLPSLYRIVIVCPERYGLVTLHQLRGRTARNGGEGYCDLLCPEPISATSRGRLQTFVDITDGFVLAEMDLRARGAGDLGAQSQRQSGADGTCLFGVKLDAELLSEALPVFERRLPIGDVAS